MKNIRDGLYNEYISIHDDELPVLDSVHVQRLRNISQLGLSSLVYPTATHTRFSHSLGVMNLANKLANTLDLDPVETKCVRMAGLLHDVGHGPFSHASEYAVEQEHEAKSCEVVEMLADKGKLPVSAHKVNQYIKGERQPSIIASDIDADRMDYLKRDSHFTGIPHGNIDTDTIINAVETKDGKLLFKRRAVEAIEQLLVSRKNMMGSVYSHPTVKIAENMLRKAIINTDMSDDELWKLDDAQLHTKLLNSDGVPHELYTRINQRNLYKTAYELRYRHLQNGQDRPKLDENKIRNRIFTETDVKPHQLIVKVHEPRYTTLDIDIKTKNGIYPIQDVSNSHKLFNKPSGGDLIISVFTPESKQDEVNAVVNEIIQVK